MEELSECEQQPFGSREYPERSAASVYTEIFLRASSDQYFSGTPAF
jgi:hypothetical protein